MNHKQLNRIGRLVSAILVSLATLPTVAKDIVVSSAYITKEFPIGRPLQADSLSVTGAVFDWEEAFNYNIPLYPMKLKGAKSIDQGALLTSHKDRAVMRYITFTVDAEAYAKATLTVKGIEKYRIYHNGIGVSYVTDFSPRRHQITLVTLTLPDKTDTLNVSLVTDSLTTLDINSTKKRAFTLEDQTVGLRCSRMRVSPSGKYLMATYYNTLPSGDYQYHTTITEIATNKTIYRVEGDPQLKWWPNKDLCYFTRKANQMHELVTLDPATLRQNTVAQNLSTSHFMFSPAGDYLLFSEEEKANPDFKDGFKHMQDPDDRAKGYRNKTALYKYDLATQQMQRLTFGKTTLYAYDISADGKKVLVAAKRRELTKRPFSFQSLYLLDVQTLRLDTVLTDEGFARDYILSPDGRHILAKGSPESFGGIGSRVAEGQIPNMYDYQLFLITPGQGIKPLTRDFAPSVEHFVWAKKNNKIYFTANNRDYVDLYELDPATGKTRQVNLPIEVVTSFDLSEDALRMVYTGHWARGNRNLYTCDLTQKQPQSVRIGEIDYERSLDGVNVAVCKDFNILSARGDSLYSRYYLPENFDPKKQYPVIVYYYGGVAPTERYFEFAYPFQVLAGQGYIVFVTQPSGSVGFGQKFAAHHVNAWGIRTADDIIESVSRFADTHSFVDKGKIGCMGASYGGFMTQYLISHSDLFAAAISHAGISNIASYWGGGDWGYSYSTVAAANSYPWNNDSLYVKQSPLFNADKIHTPLLLLHGDKDNNVPPTESLQMYTALKLLGREVQYVQVADQDHFISDPKKQRQWQHSIFAWFAKWLKDQPTWWNALYPDTAK